MYEENESPPIHDWFTIGNVQHLKISPILSDQKMGQEKGGGATITTSVFNFLWKGTALDVSIPQHNFFPTNYFFFNSQKNFTSTQRSKDSCSPFRVYSLNSDRQVTLYRFSAGEWRSQVLTFLRLMKKIFPPQRSKASCLSFLSCFLLKFKSTDCAA